MLNPFEWKKEEIFSISLESPPFFFNKLIVFIRFFFFLIVFLEFSSSNKTPHLAIEKPKMPQKECFKLPCVEDLNK